MSPCVKECKIKDCPELGEEEFPPGSKRLRKVCILAGNRIPGNIICPKEIHPLNCGTCKKTCEECLQRYNRDCYIRGCALHTDAVKNILPSIPTCDLVREIERRERVSATSVLPGWSYEVEKNPPENEEDDENIYNSLNDESDNPGRWSSLSGEGPAKILVVVD